MDGLRDSYTCHACRLDKATHCATCRRIEQDEIRMRRRPVLDAGIAAAAASQPPSSRTDSPCGVTDLPADVEDRIRALLFEVTGMPPVDVLMLHHVARGGSVASFPDALAKFGSSVAGCRMGRSTAHKTWKRIVERFEPFSALCAWDAHRRAREGRRAHGGGGAT